LDSLRALEAELIALGRISFDGVEYDIRVTLQAFNGEQVTTADTLLRHELIDIARSRKDAMIALAEKLSKNLVFQPEPEDQNEPEAEGEQPESSSNDSVKRKINFPLTLAVTGGAAAIGGGVYYLLDEKVKTRQVEYDDATTKSAASIARGEAEDAVKKRDNARVWIGVSVAVVAGITAIWSRKNHYASHQNKGMFTGGSGHKYSLSPVAHQDAWGAHLTIKFQ
jgi:hypothetical protein